MGNLNADQKLKLAQMIRAESQDNRLRMRSRERILYSDQVPLFSKGNEKELYALEDTASIQESGGSLFKLRLILAVFLFAGFLILDAGGGTIGGMSAAMLREEINKDFSTGIPELSLDFENQFPYTLFDK